jgi:peroxiredoxin
MRLQPGVEAPSFTARTWDAREIRLGDYLGGPVWLAFFRYAACPLCNLRVHQMIARYEQLTENGLVLLTVFQSPASSVAEYVGKQAPPFPILCDPEEALYALYGLEASLVGFLAPSNLKELRQAKKLGFPALGPMEGTKTRLPADFLIDAGGVIRDAFYGSRTAESIPFERVAQFGRGGP